MAESKSTNTSAMLSLEQNDRNEFGVGHRSTGKTVRLSTQYGWSTHNCSCQNKSKTGVVLYPSDPVYKNIVLLVCETCYVYKPGKVPQRQQLINWYFGIYGNSKSFVYTSGFSMNANGQLGFNSNSLDASSSCPYHTKNREMGQLEQIAIRKVIDGKLHSYDVPLSASVPLGPRMVLGDGD